METIIKRKDHCCLRWISADKEGEHWRVCNACQLVTPLITYTISCMICQENKSFHLNSTHDCIVYENGSMTRKIEYENFQELWASKYSLASRDIVE